MNLHGNILRISRITPIPEAEQNFRSDAEIVGMGRLQRCRLQVRQFFDSVANLTPWPIFAMITGADEQTHPPRPGESAKRIFKRNRSPLKKYSTG